MSTSNERASGSKKAYRIAVVCLLVFVAIFRVVHHFNREAKEREFEERMVENGKFLDDRKENPMAWSSDHTNDLSSKNGHRPLPEFPRAAIQALGSARILIESFLKEVRADNLKAAYGMTSASFKMRVGEADFEDMIGKHPGIKETDKCQVSGTVYYPNGSASMQVSSPKAAAKTVVEIKVKKEVAWEIDAFTVEDGSK